MRVRGHITIAVAAAAMLFSTTTAQAQDAKAAAVSLDVLTLHGTVGAIDRSDGTVALVGPEGGVLVMAVRDRQKLDAVQVGDPVVAQYYEAIVLKVLPARSATPGLSTQDSMISSRPGELPAGALESQVTLTTTVSAVDARARTVTIRGPLGRTETVKVQDASGLESLKEGDLVQITYTRALAIALDKRAGN